jgi:transcriptional regulator with XRE-family HTH domain
MRDFRSHLGERLKELREEQGLKAHEVAAIVGIDVTHLYNIEAARANASVDLLVALATTYKVDVADLFTFPRLHARHALREWARLTPAAKLDEAKAALERVNSAARTKKTK